jgi:hypothetical protein
MSDNQKTMRVKGHVVLHDWMINDLDLEKKELIIFAIIYGFSHTENQYFTGSLQYLAAWTKTTKRNVIRVLNSLIEKGYIGKTEQYVNGVKYCKYYAQYSSVTSVQNNSDKMPQAVTKSHGDGDKMSWGSDKMSFDTSNNNIEYNIDDRIEKETPPPTPETISEYETLSSEQPAPEERTAATPYAEILEAYNTICKSLPKAIRLSNDRKKAIRARLHDGYTFEQMRRAFANAEASPFLTGKVAGRDGRTFKADFDWIMTDKYFIKVLENKYAENKPAQSPTPDNPYSGQLYDEETLRLMGVIP